MVGQKPLVTRSLTGTLTPPSVSEPGTRQLEGAQGGHSDREGVQGMRDRPIGLKTPEERIGRVLLSPLR
jgi:hypothetical protein